MLHDDAFGVSEPLNEPGFDGKGLVVLGKHYLLLDEITEAAANYKNQSEKLFMGPYLSFFNYEGAETDYIKNYRTQVWKIYFFRLKLHVLILQFAVLRIKSGTTTQRSPIDLRAMERGKYTRPGGTPF